MALFENKMMLGLNSVYTAKTQSQVILPMVKRLVSECDRDIADIDRIAVSVGPGSYTGIRIGVAAAKAICFAGDKSCCGVSTLEGLAYNYPVPNGIVCAVMKARQSLVYAAVFRFENQVGERLTEDMIIEAAELDKMLKEYNENIVMTGDAADAFAEEYNNGKYNLAPLHLRNQSAAGVCFASLNKEYGTPEELEASYLQLVKAEKDLIEKENRK